MGHSLRAVDGARYDAVGSSLRAVDGAAVAAAGGGVAEKRRAPTVRDATINVIPRELMATAPLVIARLA